MWPPLKKLVPLLVDGDYYVQMPLLVPQLRVNFWNYVWIGLVT